MDDVRSNGPRVIFLAWSLSLLASGCTFYTSCPTAQGNNNGGAGGELPIPTGEWRNASGNLAGISSECGNMSGLAAKPDEDLLIAGIAQKGLWSSTDGGDSWESMGAGKGSDKIVNRMRNIVFDPEVTERWWEGGIYNPGGVYETTDNGRTFRMLGGPDQLGDLLSVDLSDPDRKTLAIGGHETSGGLTLSSDGGETWDPVGKGLPTGTDCTFPLILDAQTFLVGCGGYGGKPNGVYRSTNAGQSWKQVSDAGGVGAPLRASDQTIYWYSPDGALIRSSDDGVSWTQAVGSGTIEGPSIVELPDGRLASLSKHYVMVSSDQGSNWVIASSAWPYPDTSPPTGLVYAKAQKAFFIWYFTCGFDGPVPVPDDAIMRYDFDYEAS
jgi:photosystem II stability/assembly factor-like uncharacterized protein